MIIPVPMRLRDRVSRRPLPLANASFIAANVLAYVVLSPSTWAVGPGTWPWTPWTIFTYGFVHAGFTHLLFNMWFLWVFGNAVNRRVGNYLYTVIYLGTIFVIGLFASVLAGGDVLGSSGAVFAVMGMALVLLPVTLVEVNYLAVFPLTLLIGLFRRPKSPLFWFIRWGTEDLRVVVLLPLLVMLELLGFVWWGLSWSNLAHLLGFACGVAGVLLLPSRISLRSRVSA